ncbi:ABC transporter substrate-binding protein [Rhodobaculum claviforme]|uniref:Peptide ABC transporter substrate-binding protein n=1 Tax=Rhodobaculum claviforme TaxID=1549854 RepID=A0A934TN71_9RHOB|nr:ABC transporter substrate-binding protein [Rhodobaculum claviforme]MBK5928332.1 peptide ABC transporter substrate-binding protein [Rhodobaculum claviforme]
MSSLIGKGLSRRGLLQGASALGASALILPAGLRPARATPQRGGTLRLGLGHGSTSDGLDPALWDQVFVQMLGACLHNYLTVVAADGTLEAEVAESWEASADAATWTFKLRDGVRFHDGARVTAADVAASINHHRGEDSESAAKPIIAPIVEITTDGDDVVIFRLEAGNADFPFIMSDYHLPILPAADGRVNPDAGIGCGPYTLQTFDPGVEATFARFDDYWKDGHAHFDAIALYAIIDAAARQNALMSGEVDVIDRVSLNTVHLLERAPGVKLISVPGTQHYVFPMDSRADPFTDNNIRLAMKYAFDREELVRTILNGYGVVGNDHPIGRSNRFHADDLEQRMYDPDRARFHLREAGVDTLRVQLSAAEAAFNGAVDAAVLVSESAARAGITVDVVREPNDGYWSNVWMQKPFVASYWGGRPTEDWMFSTGYASGATWNETFWEHERFNEMLLQARSELDEALRAEMYAEMQAIVRDEGATVIPVFANYVMAASDRVMTPEVIGANTTLDGFRAIERWWFA